MDGLARHTYPSTVEEDTVEGLVKMHNHPSFTSNWIGLVEVEAGLRGGKKDIPDLDLGKEDDGVEVVHHIVGEATLGHALGKENLDVQHQTLEAVLIPGHLGQALTHHHQNIDHQKNGAHQVTQAKNHNHLPKSGHALDHLKLKMTMCPLVMIHQPKIGDHIPGLPPKNLNMLRWTPIIHRELT